MNLFENLQLMKESDTSIVSEFKEFLSNKNAQYIANEIGETKDGMQIVIYDGDWKHEHLYMKHLLDEFFTNKGIDISITSEEIGESDQDTYSARYDIAFNVKSPEYSADIISEDVDTTNEIKYVVTCQLATSNDDIYSEHSTLKDAIASARKAQQSFTNVKIKDLSDGSSWSDIDNAEQDLKDGLYEGKHYGGAFDISDTAYFTRDDLDEFSNEVIEQLSNATHADIIANVVDCYLDEDTNELELTVSYGEYEHTHKEKIDMRKIKVPKDLIKAYSHKFVNDFLWCFTADSEHEEMIKESVDLSEYDYVGPATGYNKGWSLYRKIVDGKGVWVAEHQQTKEVVPINYDQVQGFEPIKLQGIKKLQKDLGDMLLPKRESTNDSDWEFIEETTTNDEIFGDITEGGYYIKHYNNDMTGIIYPPSESEKLYRAKLTRKNKFNSFGSNAFIELDSAKEFLDTRAYELTSVTYEEIKQQLEEIDTHEYLKIFIDEPTKLGNVSVSIEGTLINGDPITFYDSSYIVNQRDIDFIKEQYAKASKQIDVMRERGYLGVKDESSKVEESNHNEILDKDYATGEEIYNELVKYLNSLDQIAMDGEDCNWEPSEYNAKSLNADGEIYLVSGAYILIYPYVNEWAEDYFKVSVVESNELSTQLKNGIELIFNKFKTDKWQLIFEG